MKEVIPQTVKMTMIFFLFPKLLWDINYKKSYPNV